MSPSIPTQFEYLGRWHDTKHFRAFVYSVSDQKLANNYQEFIDLVGSGLWFPTKEEAQKAVLKIEDSTPLEVEQKIEEIVPVVKPKVQKDKEISPSVLETLMEKPKNTREATKNRLRMVTSEGK